jgi:hypothetical protein
MAIDFFDRRGLASEQADEWNEVLGTALGEATKRIESGKKESGT